MMCELMVCTLRNLGSFSAEIIKLAIKEADGHQDFYPIVVNEEKEITHENIEIIKGDIHIQVPDNTDIDMLMNMLKVLLC